MTHFAYVHARPDTTDSSGVFYVGKGAGKRADPRLKRNRHHQNIVAKYGVENILVGRLECSSESVAHDLERGLIKCLRRSGVKLTNLTEGGEGSSGFVMPESAKAKIADAFTAKWQDPEYRARLSETQRAAQKDPACFTEKKQAAVLRNAELARAALQDPAVKEAARQKNSVKSREMWSDPAFKQALKEKHAARWTAEERHKKSLCTRGRIRMTDGTHERNVPVGEVETLLAKGWVKGRKPRF